jgi:hypothetical protein
METNANAVMLTDSDEKGVQYLVALKIVWPDLWSRTCQSLLMPFFPDAPTHVSTSTTSPLN